ncbi:unnamed protein product [Paramecium sonneborni]|uniref:Transmembrane protein n=1 Tax=Paramecium sonneborni TaxID=65129 RepID=A0A8S1KG23_9CILI|nr:unnamed protein product [Paramecium sonneborni]
MNIGKQDLEKNEFLENNKVNYKKEYKNVIKLGRCLFIVQFIMTGAILLYFVCFYSLLLSDNYWLENQDKFYYITIGLLLADLIAFIQHILALFAIMNQEQNLSLICGMSSLISAFIRIAMFYFMITQTEMNYYKQSTLATIFTCLQCGFAILIFELKNQWKPIPQRKWKKFFRLMRSKIPKIKQSEMKPLPKAPNSRQFSREKSQPMFNPITPTAKFRIHHNNQFLSKEKMQKTSNNFFNNTAESTKITKVQNQSLLRKPDADYKQLIFDKEDKEEELQFQALCQTLDKIL